MKKRIYTVLLCLCLVLTLLPVTAMGETKYNIWVGGEAFSSASDYTSTGNNFTYVASTKTLTLNGYNNNNNYHTFGTGSKDYAGIYVKSSTGVNNNFELTIELNGENTISGPSNSSGSNYGIYYDDGKLKFTGGGSLTVSAGTCGDSGQHNSVAIYVDDGTVTVGDECTIEASITYKEYTSENKPTNRAICCGTFNHASGAKITLGETGENGASAATGTVSNQTLWGKRYVKIATPDPAPSFSVNVTGNYTFPQATVGYGAQTPLTVTITNTGEVATGALTVSLSNNNYFELNTINIDSIAKGGTATFTVTPKTGLPVGDNNTATVTVQNVGGTVKRKFNVSFTVNSGTTTTTPTVTIVDENGNTVTSPVVGQKLKAKIENADGWTLSNYQWFALSSTNESFTMTNKVSTDQTYTVQEQDEGKYICLSVDYATTASTRYTTTNKVAAAGSNTDGTTTTGTTYYYYTGTSEDIVAPKTADPGVAVYAAISVMSLLGMGFVQKKRK